MKTVGKRKMVLMARVIKLKDDDRSFDFEFWQRVGAAGRFEAAWDMLVNCPFRKLNVNQQRLKRSVAVLKRRGS